MFENIQFEPSNFMAGLVVGLVLAFLFKLSALKKLGLKLDKIGLDLGVEGFESDKQHQGNAISFRDVSGTVGDVVSGNLDKSVKASNFYKNLQSSIARIVGERRGLMRRKKEIFRWESNDANFISELKALNQNSVDNCTQKWIEQCLQNPDCQRQIQEVINLAQKSGWEPVRIDFDNHDNGVHINLEFEQELILKIA